MENDTSQLWSLIAHARARFGIVSFAAVVLVPQPRWKSPSGSTTPDTSNSYAAARIEESRFDVYSFKTVILMKGHGNSGDVNLQPTYLG
jgi:hypothetical protein